MADDSRKEKKLLTISTDSKIFEEGSAVRARQIEYARDWGEVHIIVLSNKTTEKEIVLASNCWAYSTDSKQKLFAPFAAMKLGRFIISKRGITDITCQDPFLTALAAVGLKKQCPQVQLEIQIHTDIGSPHFTYTLGNKIRKTLALNYLKHADHVRVVSNKIKEYVVGTIGISAEKVEVRPIVTDVEKIKNAPIIEGADLHKKYPQFEKIILMASRLETEKNIPLAIKAFAEVIKKEPKTGLVIVGSGSQLSNLKTLVAHLGIVSSVIFEPWVDEKTLYSYYKTTDLFLVVSLYEGYGLTLLEAKTAGCRVVSTDVGIAREIGAIIVPDTIKGVLDGIMSH